MLPPSRLSMAISTLVGQNIGAGNTERAGQIGRLGGWLGFWALSVLGIVAFFFAPQLISFFIPGDPSVIATGAFFLRIMALSWGFMGVQFALTGVLRASGNMVVTMVLTLVSQWVLQFPLAYVLSKHTTLGAVGIWWAFPISNVIIALITIGVYATGDWKKTKLTEEEQLTETVSEAIMKEEGFR